MDPAALAYKLRLLVDEPERRQRMRDCQGAMARPGAARAILDAVRNAAPLGSGR